MTVSSRREPLLWLQLLAIGAIPLELLLLRLVLAGSDLGPIPALERLLTWAIAVLAPGVLLWRRPADWGSLLLVRASPSARTREQRQLSALQDHPLIRIGTAVGALLLLPTLWWIDSSAVLVQPLSPLEGSTRLSCLLASVPLLTLLLWQWHQLIQSILLLSRSQETISNVSPLDGAELTQARLSPGLGLLRLTPLDWDQARIQSLETESVASGTIKPEERPEDRDGTQLDAEIAEGDAVSSAEAEAHHEQTEATGSEQSDPEQPPEPPPGSP